MSKNDVLRKSRDEIAKAVAADAEKLGTVVTAPAIDAFLTPILEEADKIREEQAAHVPRATLVDEYQDFDPRTKLKAGETWVEEADVGTATFHSDGRVTVDETLQKLAGLRGRRPEELRRKLFIKYLKANHPALWQEFVAVAAAGGPAKVVERKLHEVLARAKKLIPVNPWNPCEPGKIIVG